MADMTLEEALAAATADDGSETVYCTVDDDTRLVTVPDKYKKLGVESDEKAKRIWFRFPKFVGNNGVDLSAIGVRVNFRNANGDGDIYIVEDLTADGDYVIFSWELTRKVTAYKGNVSFVVCAVKSATDGTIKNEWNTTLNKECEVLEGLEVTEQITQENPDIIEYILANLGSGGTGLSTEAIDKLEEVGNYLVYTTADGGSKWTELISILRNSSSGDSGGTEVTISSISATYTGGDVEEGTALSDLTGITVIATYSDGSTATVTGYTLSGEIAEGENTITVSYGGKTTTFTVIGTASVSAGETIVYNVFNGEYINSGYSGDNYTNYGANYNIYQEEIDVTDASTLYYRFGRNNKVMGATQSGLKLGVYSSDGSVLGVLDLSDSSTVTEVDGKYDINGLETLDDGTIIYGIYVASVSLSSFENKSYVKFAVLRSSKFVPSWNGNAQSTSVLSLEV